MIKVLASMEKQKQGFGFVGTRLIGFRLGSGPQGLNVPSLSHSLNVIVPLSYFVVTHILRFLALILVNGVLLVYVAHILLVYAASILLV
ncbi:hypothetical protein VNO78_23512 [Psophocarpus tetragonolobus]|uniref:Uncharacterized protein n=1 Tax=Psophocarpus tetragonolobus TaxID=3891 RepID=A0AAN9S494_PSOTE